MCQKKLFYYWKDKQANKYYKVINLKQKKSRKNCEHKKYLSSFNANNI